MNKDWRKNYFDESYIGFYSEQLTEEKAKNEVKFLISLFDENVSTILDMPCGYGRHSNLFAEAGYTVLGVDIHDSQLSVAEKNAKKSAKIKYVKADIRNFSGDGFDVVLNLFSSFGYFDRDTDMKVFKNIVGSAKEGGLIVIDVRNPILQFKEFSQNNWHLTWFKNNMEGVEDFDPLSNRHKFTYSKGGVRKKGELNMYFPAEYKYFFESFRCTLKNLYGDYLGTEYKPLESTRLIMIATKNQSPN